MMSHPERRGRRRSDETRPGRVDAPAAAGQVAGQFVLERAVATDPARLLETPRLDLLERAVRRSRVLLMVLDPDGVILLAEGGGALGLGLDPDAAVGCPALDCLGSDGELAEAVRRALAGETASATVQRGQRELELSFEPIADPHERREAGLPMVLVVGTDVTAYRLALSAVRNREDRLRGIMDTVLDGIVAFNGEGLVEGFKPAASRMYGYSAGEVMGRPVALLFPERAGGGLEAARAVGQSR